MRLRSMVFSAASVAWLVVACGGGPGAADPSSGPSNKLPAGSAKSGGSGPVAQIECGDHFSCAAMKDGSLKCWGRDEEGQLGDGGGEDKTKPISVPGLSGVEEMALASSYGCALLKGGAVQCWGTGRVAGGKSLTKARPAPVSGVDAASLSASGVLACATSSSGSLTCWGAERDVKPDLGPGKIEDVAVAATHGCVLKEGGQVRCWGAHEWGGSNKRALDEPKLPSPVTEVATGDSFACAIGKDKKVYCWGANDLGQLGVPADFDIHEAPAAVPGVAGAESLALGEASACAIVSGGKAICWGSNYAGELGLGRSSPNETPAPATALGSLKSLCFASAHACAQTQDDQMICWGFNAYGQLGDGTKQNRLAPVRVGF